MGLALNIEGKKFNRLTAICKTDERKDGKVVWWFKCDCGVEKKIAASLVKTGSTKSCGCLDREQVIKRNKASATHGMTGTPTFKSWESMKQRCDNANNPDYKRYGGRGITYSKRWKKFENFLSDMGPRPVGLTLDRINSNGMYCLKNCRWADLKTQANNLSSNVKYKNKTVAQWCEETGVSANLAYSRIKRGWPFLKAVTDKRRYTNGNRTKWK